MTRYVVSKEIEFDAGHRVPDHEGKCSSPHGHRYRIVLAVQGDLQMEGSRTGMVLDFGEIKKVLTEVHDKYDHGFMFYRLDARMRALVDYSMPKWDWKWVSVEFSPTAENLAKDIFEYCEERFDDLALPGTPLCVEVWETPTSMAMYPAPS